MHHLDGSAAGAFRCLGCGRRAGWNELAAVFGLKKYGKEQARLDSQEVPSTNVDDLDGELLAKKVYKREELRMFDLSNERAVVASGIKFNKWRTFRLPFLERIGIKLAYVRKIDPVTGEVNTWGRYYLHLPIIIRGKQRGYIKAQIEKPDNKDIPSYINSPGSWSLKYGLFPYDYVVLMLKELEVSTVALVEGPRDALRLIRHGIPALCIMGTQSWSPGKLRLLEFTGATSIVLMMDGDQAGLKATRLIKTGLDVNGNQVAPPLSSSFFVKIVRLWNAEVPGSTERFSGYDPGNCPVEILDSIKNLIV